MERSPRRFSRWDFIKLGTAAAAGVLLYPATVSVATAPSESTHALEYPNTQPIEPERTIFSIFGLHTTPDLGGGNNVSLTLSDAGRLKAHGLTVLNPWPFLLERAGNVGFEVVVRIHQPGNVFVSRSIEEEVEKAFKQGRDAIFQTNNEVNLLRETGGVFVSPKEHLENQFLPAVRKIIEVAQKRQRRAKILITPFAQNAPAINGIDERAYSEEFYDRLAPYMEKLACDFYLGLHAYIFQPGEDPLEYAEERYAEFRRRTGRDLLTYITEGGLHHNEQSNFSQKDTAEATIRILQTPIPDNFPVQAYNLWVAANYVQRPWQHRLSRNPDLDVFEKAALRGIDGVTETFLAIESEAANKA